MEDNHKTPLSQQIIRTVILTAASALVLGFFSFFGWLGMTILDVKDNQIKIIQELEYRNQEKSKTDEVLTEELFKLKNKDDEDSGANDPVNNDNKLKDYRDHIQQQIVIPREKLK
jgi:hypothetical protein